MDTMGLLGKVGIVTSIILFLAIYMERYFRFRAMMNHGQLVFNHSPGLCQYVKGINGGAEDIEVLPDGIAFITSGLKYNQAKSNPVIDRAIGRILTFDFYNYTLPAKPVLIEGKLDLKTFSPHGISSWTDPHSGVLYLFVVNHPTDKEYDTVEKFVWDHKRKLLIHVLTIVDDFFGHLNDIVAISDTSFYVTNTHYSWSSLGRHLEFTWMLYWGQVIHYHDKQGHVVAKGMFGPNGINMSPDRKYVYVAGSLEKNLIIFKRNEDGILSLHKRVPLKTSPDNINIDAEHGDLWVAVHPSLSDLFAHMSSPVKHTSPSQVLRMSVTDGEVSFIEEVYSDNGHRIRGASVAAYYHSAMLIGSVYHRLLYCIVYVLEEQ